VILSASLVASIRLRPAKLLALAPFRTPRRRIL